MQICYQNDLYVVGTVEVPRNGRRWGRLGEVRLCRMDSDDAEPTVDLRKKNCTLLTSISVDLRGQTEKSALHKAIHKMEKRADLLAAQHCNAGSSANQAY